MADVQEVIALNLDKKCLSLFPWKEGGEPDISTSFSQLFFKPVLDISDMEGYLLYFCFIQASGKVWNTDAWSQILESVFFHYPDIITWIPVEIAS